MAGYGKDQGTPGRRREAVHDRFYVSTRSSTGSTAKLLAFISKRLNLGLKVEVWLDMQGKSEPLYIVGGGTMKPAKNTPSLSERVILLIEEARRKVAAVANVASGVHLL